MDYIVIAMHRHPLNKLDYFPLIKNIFVNNVYNYI